MVGFLALSETSVFELILMQTHVILEPSQLYIRVLHFLNETTLRLISLERGSPTIYALVFDLVWCLCLNSQHVYMQPLKKNQTEW